MNKFKIDNNHKKIIYWSLVVLWMLLIFNLSAQPVTKSNNLSKNVAQVVVDTIEKINPNTKPSLGNINHIIRKNAHFFSYMILGILTTIALKNHKLSLYKVVSIALLICILYAISDECHQLFVPGRGGQLRDVIIDTFGAIVGILLTIRISKYTIKCNYYPGNDIK